MIKICQIKSISDINKSKWQNLIKETNPFLSYDFFYAMEKSGCTSVSSGWEPNHFIIKSNESIVGLIPNFKKNNSYGEYIFDQSWANAYASIGIRYYPKFLSAIPFTPINSNKFFFDKNIENKFILQKLKEHLEKENISSCHFNFINKEQSCLLNNKDFLTRKGIQYHWHNNNYHSFDDFLDSFKARKKKNILKERKSIHDSGIVIEKKIGDEILMSDINFFFECYSSTIDKKWSNKYLNLDFFQLLRTSNIVNQMVIFIAKDMNNRKIASTLSFFDNKKLFGRYWGSLIDVPFLHFELCYYQSIEFAIEKGIILIESGAQGEHKISRGYKPSIIYSNHWIKNYKIRIAIEDFLLKESHQVDETIKYLNKLLPYK